MLTTRIKYFQFFPFVFIFLFVLVMNSSNAMAFSDSAQTWPEAQQAIAEMSTAELVKGYEDGSFKPDKNVSKIEVVALLIRVLGLEAQANSLEKAKVDYQMPDSLLWGRGYLIAGVQRGMLDKEYLYQLKPSAPANRAEVAVLIYHALKLSPDNTPLTFEDASVIPEAYRSCVAAVVKKNIMVGLPGNLFKPNDYITRAQMAVLMSRLVENGLAAPYPDRWITGNMSSYNGDTRLITVQLANNTLVDKLVDGGCLVYRDGKVATLKELAPGQKLRMVLNSPGKVAFIRIAGGQTSTPAVPPTTMDTLRGTVLSVSTSFLTLRSNGARVPLEIHNSITVIKKDLRKNVTDIREEDLVEVKAHDGFVYEVRIIGDVSGEVRSVYKTGGYAIVIRDNLGFVKEYEVNSDVTVHRSDRSISFVDLVEGDFVSLELDGNGRVAGVEVIDGASDASGRKIIDFSEDAARYIRLEDENSGQIRYNLLDDVKVFRDGEEIGLDEVPLGAIVRVRLSGSTVTRIDVTDYKNITVAGTLSSISSSSKRLTIKQINGNRFTYQLGSVYRLQDVGGSAMDFEELKRGWEVEIQLQDGEIYRLEVMSK